jgi:FAD/FMN-containing dehydrogenase
MDEKALINQLTTLIGEKAITTVAADIAPWQTDWRGRVTGDAIALISPTRCDQVQDVVRIAGEYGVPIVPQGGNTGMVAGAVPRPAERALILSLRKMNAIRTIDQEDNSLVAEAGVILSEVHKAAIAVDKRFPLSLGAKDSATVGGLISTNAGGTQVLRFGSMRALTLGVEAVLPDGSLFEGLSSLRKDNRGYDLRQLLAGAEGTLGIITAASLKLYPAALHREVAWVALNSPQEALRLLRRLETALGEAVESFELMPHSVLALVLEHIPGSRAPLETVYPWYALVEMRAPTRDSGLRDSVEATLAAALEDGDIRDAVLAESESQAEAFWKLRETIAEAEKTDSMSVKHDVSVPVSSMPDFIELATAAVRKKFVDSTVIAFGHLGDGNVHFNVLPPAGADQQAWFAKHAEQVTRFVHDLTLAEGGSLSAEHGIGQLKLEEFERLASPARLAAVQAIKRAIDPQGIMNPGKLVPLANPSKN